MKTLRRKRLGGTSTTGRKRSSDEPRVDATDKSTGWQHKPLSDLCDFSNGHGFGPKDWTTRGLPIIRIQNLNGSQEFNYYNGKPDPEWLVEPGTLLFAWAGTKGVSFGPKLWNGPVGVLNQHIYRVHPKRCVDAAWLHLALQEITERIERKAHGFKSTLLHVSKADIVNQIVDVPPKGQQTAIAAIIDTWEKALDSLCTLIAAKQRSKAALMQQLLSGRRRLKGFAGKWTMQRLGALAEEVAIPNRGKLGTERLYAVTKADGMVPMREHVKGASVQRCNLVERDWFAYNPMRVNIGSLARWRGSDPVMVSPDYVVFRCNPAKLFPGLLDHLRRSWRWKQFVAIAGDGSVRVRIYFDRLAEFAFPCPPLREQEAIAAVLDTCDEELRLLRAQRAAVDQQKRGLMQRLLTGRIRVRV